MNLKRVLEALPAILAGRRAKWVFLALWAAVAAGTVPFAGRLESIESDRLVNYLPQDAQSTEVEKLLRRLPEGRSNPAIVVYARSGGLTKDDAARIAADRAALARALRDTAKIGAVRPAPDGAAALLPVQLPDGREALAGAVATVRRTVGSGGSGLEIGVTGPAAYVADKREAVQGIDLELLLTAGAAVAIVLLVIYRSPLLWLIPLATTSLALAAARAAVYALASHSGLTVTELSAGVLDVLVFGAGTDYALLLIARYREELAGSADHHRAMARALRRAAPAIVASGSTVILGLLCLLAASLNSDRGLGPVAAVGIVCALAAALTVLPALFLLAGRWVFWPARPRAEGKAATEGGLWAAVGERLGRRPRRVWIVMAAVLALCAGGLAGLHLGLPQSKTFVHSVGAVRGQEILDRHFPPGVETPTIVVGSAAHAAPISQAIAGTPGVVGMRAMGRAGDHAIFAVLLEQGRDGAAAYAAIDRLRERLAALPGADALVGGPTAIDADIAAAAARDRLVVMPLVLVAVLAVLGALLRAVVAPLMLVATVILSFAAALGISALVFDWGFGFAGLHRSVPLDTFIFLVALGIDYNIFLMSRARQEARQADTPTGMKQALARTGGVITAAGVVLAATFAALTLLPLVVLVEVGFIIAFGILLDTFLVRSILVPALVFDIGKRIWWPSRLAR